MSRIADAHARAGVRLPGDEEQRWNTEREAAERYLENPNPKTQIPKPKAQEPARKTEHARLESPDPGHETIDVELAAAVRRIFLAPKSTVRSLLFCTMPGDRMSDVAWRAAEFLAAQSGRRVAFVEDGTSDRFPGDKHPLVTRIGWYEPTSAGAVTSHRDGDVAFPFVIADATAPKAEDLIALARQMDGVIAVISEGETRRDVAQRLIATLRQVNLIGAILVTGA
jgi:hypothetical protein